MTTINIGIIGCGNRISGVARECARMDRGFRVVAVADPQGEALRAKHPELLKDAVFHAGEDGLLARKDLDGIMIGTRCLLHAPMAVKAAKRGLPLFLEKPVAISMPQLRALRNAFRRRGAPPVVVSFPLRVSPLVEKAKVIVDSGRLGTIEQLVAFNDVPYGDVYFGGWYRNWDEVGGLWLQKATHDLDYLAYLAGSKPKRVAAMNAQRVWGGTMPFGLRCRDCRKRKTCPESPFNSRSMIAPGARPGWRDWRLCVYAKGIRNEDMGACLIEYENGAQTVYHQNFFARRNAARRGARLYGYRGTLEFDWYAGTLFIHWHHRAKTERVPLPGQDAHFGGDAVLCRNFVDVLEGRCAPRTPIAAGLESALTCLKARESSADGRFHLVRMP
ncbi:MAG: Gfo/Idh/MocA family oxidoreductase [Candidatus Coatesbacteria bacterium]